MNYTIINSYHKTDINLNNIFRYYITNYLQYKPFFTKYNPQIYRTKNYKITVPINKILFIYKI
mgnify:CR=1 FL=1